MKSKMGGRTGRRKEQARNGAARSARAICVIPRELAAARQAARGIPAGGRPSRSSGVPVWQTGEARRGEGAGEARGELQKRTRVNPRGNVAGWYRGLSPGCGPRSQHAF